MISIPEFESQQVLLVFSNKGDKISFSNDNIVVKDKDNKVKHQSTCYKLFLVIIIGNTSITSGLIQRAVKFNFSICLMSPYFRVYQTINAIGDGNTILRKKQYINRNIEVGKFIIKNKLENQKVALKSIRSKSDLLKESINNIDKYIISLEDKNTLNEIMGIEGVAAKIYFSQIFDNIKWNGRKPRIKSDYVNVLLDIGYNLLFNFIEAIAKSFGFDTYCGYLHQDFYMRKSLICDLVEPFRPIVDLTIRKGINLKQFKEDDFERYGYRFVLPWKKSPRYVSIIMKEILEYKNDIFVYIQSFYRAIMKDKKKEDYPVFQFKW